MPRLRRALTAGLVVAAVLAGAPPLASAHALVLESSPRPGEVVKLPPARLVLRFNTRIEKALSGITLTGPGGRPVPLPVAGRFTPTLPSLSSPPISDLLATAAPITDVMATRKREEYQWSEYNHHVAGLFVFLMGLLALLERTSLSRWARHWPLLFLGLAAFLFIRNDPRAWPLGPAGFWESMTLPDVLQHRAAAALIVALAAFECAVRTGRLRGGGWAYVFPLLCAGGGALLLTHSHAMFNLKAEFLIEVTHAPLGVLAVLMGVGRWLELRLPAPESRVPGRLWACAMVLVGTVLLFYREG